MAIISRSTCELAREVDDAERILASAVNVETVHGSVVVEELQILFLDLGVQRFEIAAIGRSRPEQGLVKNRSQVLITDVVQVNAVEREGLFGCVIHRHRRREEIDKLDSQLHGHFTHRGGVKLDVRVVPVAGQDVASREVFVSNGRNEDQLRRILAVISRGRGLLYETQQVAFELVESFRPIKRFVEAEERQNNIGLMIFEAMPVV